VLETGDGRSSKFSGDGKVITDTYTQNFRLQSDPNLTMDQLISADKKLTHDFMEQIGYGHIVSEQVCFPRQYEEGLSEKIALALNLVNEDYVILKLCNRSRGAGVVITPMSELNDVLEELLTAPDNTEHWFKEQLRDANELQLPPVFDMPTGSFNEQCRHWWSNESPVFVAERWCKSLPTEREGEQFDGTLRVGFALERRTHAQPDKTDVECKVECESTEKQDMIATVAEHRCCECGFAFDPTSHAGRYVGEAGSDFEGKLYCKRCWTSWEACVGDNARWEKLKQINQRATEMQLKQLQLQQRKRALTLPGAPPSPIAPEELQIHWLGAYWKLPKTSMTSKGLDIRDRVVSAARTSGTATINLDHLLEVYASLGDSVQQLFALKEPTPDDIIKKYDVGMGIPELAAYYIARLGTQRLFQNPLHCKQLLEMAHLSLKDHVNPSRSCVESFMDRAFGVLTTKLRHHQNSEVFFQNSLHHMPTNSTTFLMLGVAQLQKDCPEKAEGYFMRSLLLDPDFKSPYVMLSIAYLRLGKYLQAKRMSEQCLSRHPDTPQSDYHIGIACCKLALEIEIRTVVFEKATPEDVSKFEALRSRASDCFSSVRDVDPAKKKPGEPPWSPIDDMMVAALAESGPRVSGDPRIVHLPSSIGWQYIQFRIR